MKKAKIIIEALNDYIGFLFSYTKELERQVDELEDMMIIMKIMRVIQFFIMVLTYSFPLKWWRRRESNPRPQQQLYRVIHKFGLFTYKQTKSESFFAEKLTKNRFSLYFVYVGGVTHLVSLG